MSNQREDGFKAWYIKQDESIRDFDVMRMAWQAAIATSDAKYQARIKELEDALHTVGGINYDAARVRLSAVVDKALSTTTPSEALQRALLESRIDERSKHYYSDSLQCTRLEELRSQLAALGE